MPIILRSLRRSLSPALFVMLASASASAVDRPIPDGLADVAEGSDAVGDGQERLAQFDLRRRPAVKKPVVDDDKDDDKDAPTSPGTKAPSPFPIKKPELREGAQAPRVPIDRPPAVKKPPPPRRDPRVQDPKDPSAGDDRVRRTPRTPTDPPSNDRRRTTRPPRNRQPPPDDRAPSGGGGGGGGDGGCCCCSPKVTGLAVGGGIMGGVAGLVVGGVIGAGIGYVVAPSGAPPAAPSETDKQIAMGVGALVGGLSGVVLGGVIGVGAGAALGGVLSE